MTDQIVNISYDDYDLQDEDIIIEKIIGDDSLPQKIQDINELPVEDGGKITSEKIASRRITIEGIVKNTSASGLIGKIEEIKEIASRKEKTLIITQPVNNQRIYTASVDGSPDFSARPAWAVNIAPIRMSFICTKPFAVNTQTAISGVYNIDSSITNLSVGISGTAEPRPRIYFNTTASGSKFLINNVTSNESIEVPTTFSGTGRSLLIDTEKSEVSIDGLPENFKGSFPDFKIGNNELQIVTVGSAGSAKDQSFDDVSLTLASAVFGGLRIKGQSFIATLNNLLYVEFFLSTRTPIRLEDITVELRDDSGGEPDTLIASATIEKFNSNTPSWRRAIFNSAISVIPGNTYYLLLKSSSSYSYSYGLLTVSSSSQYADGNAIWSDDNGANWFQPANGYDRLFRTFGNIDADLTGKLVIQYNPRKW